MIIPSEVRSTYHTYDPETALFLDHFDEPKGSKILEIGAHDNPVSEMLVDLGFDVYGVDLREYDQPTCRHKHIVGDFNRLPNEFWKEHRETFDCAIAISTLEHFGLGTYKEGIYTPHYDTIACRYVWDLLKEGGRFYVTVPYGGKFWEEIPHWRVYDTGTLFDRLIMDFSVDRLACAVVEDFHLNGEQIKVGTTLNPLIVMSLRHGQPCVSAFVRMFKDSTFRKNASSGMVKNKEENK